MTVLPCTNIRMTVNGYELNITPRLVGVNEAPYMRALIVHTTRIYVYLTKLIEAGKTEVPAEYNISAEVAVGNNTDIVGETPYVFEPFSENRVTVFCWNHRIELTLHSCDEPQQALTLHYETEAAKAELRTLYPNTAQTSAPASAETPAPVNTPKPPMQASGDVISATRAPNPNAPQYAPGQLVSFLINKIAAGSNKGSATYALWGTLGQKYALKTIYKCKPNSDENSSDYIAAMDTLVSLGLSLDKPETHGNWKLVCQAAHVTSEKDGMQVTKEYMNVQSLAAV